MNIVNMFDKKGPVDRSPKEISASSRMECAPFIYDLESFTHYSLTREDPRHTALKTREHLADLSFISAFDFGLVKEGWSVFDHLALGWQRTTRGVALFFKTDLKNLDSIAVTPGYYSEKALTRIVLSERYEITAEIQDRQGSLEELLKKNDAVLLHGKDAVLQTQTNSNWLDITEQWYDMTGLPFVNAFWVGRAGRSDSNDGENLAQALAKGQKNLAEIVKEYASDKAEEQLFESYLQNTQSYQMGDLEREALVEFYRYAFFYSLIDYMPEFNFIGE